MRRVMHVWWWCVRGMEVAGEEHRGVERCAVRGTMCCPWNDGATWNIAVRTGLIRCAPGPLVRTAKVFRHSRAHESPFYARDHRRAHGTRMGTRMGTGTRTGTLWDWDGDGTRMGTGTSRSGAPTTSSPATASRRAARGSSPRRLFCVYLRSWGGLAVLSGMPGHKPQKSRLTTTGSGEHAVKRRCQDAAFDLSEAVFGRIQSCGTSAGCFLLRLDFLYLRC